MRFDRGRRQRAAVRSGQAAGTPPPAPGKQPRAPAAGQGPLPPADHRHGPTAHLARQAPGPPPASSLGCRLAHCPHPRHGRCPAVGQEHRSGTRAARLAWLRSGVSCVADRAAGRLPDLSPGGPAHWDLAVGSVAPFRAFGQSLPLGSRARRSSRSARSPRESCSFARALKAGAESARPASSRVAWFPASPCTSADPAVGDTASRGAALCGAALCGAVLSATTVPVTPYVSV